MLAVRVETEMVCDGQWERTRRRVTFVFLKIDVVFEMDDENLILLFQFHYFIFHVRFPYFVYPKLFFFILFSSLRRRFLTKSQ